ncbi:MAG: YceI family protein [Flavobacteriaceae bacterium]
MKKIVFCLVVSMLTTFSYAQSAVKIASAEITFNFINNDVDGSISGFSSSSLIDLTTMSNSIFEGSVDVETLKTGNFLRDWHLKSGKYFDVDAHPKITFKSTSVQETNDGITVKGMLTIKGITKELNIEFKKTGNDLMGTTTLFTSDFDIQVKDDHDQNKVVVHMVFRL